MQRTVDATILSTTAQNVFMVYHFNFGSVLTGALCSSKRLQLQPRVMYEATYHKSVSPPLRTSLLI